jgi:hypothetical protein
MGRESERKVLRDARLLGQVNGWSEGVLRLWACDCVQGALDSYSSPFPERTIVRNALHSARRFARGQATMQELEEAQSSARAVQTAVNPRPDYHGSASDDVARGSLLGRLSSQRPW